MDYTIKKLADMAGVSVRTLHYYDQIGLLKPASRASNRYRKYDEAAALRLQQIMFFRELDFGLEEIRKIMSKPDFDVLEALKAHRVLLMKRSERINDLVATVDRTIKKIRGETDMKIKEYYEGFSDEQIERYRKEVKERWGEDTLRKSEERVIKMGREKFTSLQAEGNEIFKAIADNMDKGYNSVEIQEQVAKWRQWLENFHHYLDESLVGLGRTYSEHPEFAVFFRKIHLELPEFLTGAIEYYTEKNK